MAVRKRCRTVFYLSVLLSMRCGTVFRNPFPSPLEHNPSHLCSPTALHPSRRPSAHLHPCSATAPQYTSTAMHSSTPETRRPYTLKTPLHSCTPKPYTPTLTLSPCQCTLTPTHLPLHRCTPTPHLHTPTPLRTPASHDIEVGDKITCRNAGCFMEAIPA